MFERLLLLSEKYPLDIITYLSSGLPVSLGLFRFRYLSGTSKLITAFFLFYLANESVALWASLLRKNNLYLQNVGALINTWVVLAIALSCFVSYRWKRISLGLAIVCTVTIIITYQSKSVSSVGLSAFRLFAIFFCLAYFNEILTDVRIKHILLHTLFWFSSGLLIYSAGTFFIMLFSGYWYNVERVVPAEIFDKYWNISQVLFIIFSIMSALGLWTSKYEQKNLL